MKKLVPALVLCLSSACAAWSQGRPTASRAGDLQVGVNYASADPDRLSPRFRGVGFYADFDFREHFGVEVDFHELNDPSSLEYERSYEFGGRYVRRYHFLKPYARLMYGRGVYNFKGTDANGNVIRVANLAYNQADVGAGVDIPVHERVNVRAEYEYQRWFGFPPNGLTPSMFTFGVAYHFPAGKPR